MLKNLRKHLTQHQFNKAQSLCFAKPDALSIRRSELIQQLCKAHKAPQEENVPNVSTWASKFISSAHLLENYMLLRHHKEAKVLMFKFRSIDPDRTERLTTDEDTLVNEKTVNEYQTMEEISFLTQFAFLLKAAGYDEIPQDVVKKCIEKSHKYDSIELEAQHKNYMFIRFWVFGRNEINNVDAESKLGWKPSFGKDKTKRVLHDRVIVASRSKTSSNMILKGFKDIPLDHLEALLPEAKIKIPRFRKFLLNATLSITGIFAFFNIGMVILTEFHINLLFVFMLFTGIFAYRISERHKIQQNKHVLALKRMLYYKSTANNSGLVLDIVNKAHERALKEALVVYGTALRLAENGELVSERHVVESARDWLSSVNQYDVSESDINFSSSFALLQRLGLFILLMHDTDAHSPVFRVLSPEETSKLLLLRVQELAAE